MNTPDPHSQKPLPMKLIGLLAAGLFVLITAGSLIIPAFLDRSPFGQMFEQGPAPWAIPENEQDRELSSKIIDSELSGVFNWVLQGLNRLLIQKKFTECIAVREQVKAFRQQSDSVLMFIEDEGLQVDALQYLTLKELFFEYRTFCDNSGHRPCSNTTFSGRFKGAGYEVKRLAIGNVVYCKKVGFNLAASHKQSEDLLPF